MLDYDGPDKQKGGGRRMFTRRKPFLLKSTDKFYLNFPHVLVKQTVAVNRCCTIMVTVALDLYVIQSFHNAAGTSIHWQYEAAKH